MKCFATFSVLILLITPPALTRADDLTQGDRAAIDRIVGVKGAYVPDDRVYKIVLPLHTAATVQENETLSPNFGLNSWAAFSSAIHSPAILTGEFLLLDDEVNPVLSVALDAGLEVTGLAVSSVFDGAPVHTLNVVGRGSYQRLALAFRKGLDEIHRVRVASTSQHAKWTQPSLQIDSAIDAQPLNAVLTMRGTTVDGVYRAAIGKRAMLHGELVGREMGISTWVSLSGTNAYAVAQGEFVETPDTLQKVLKAMRARGLYIGSIRNHTTDEHPPFIFVQYWGEGIAANLANSIRYVLDVEIGAIGSGAKP